MRSGTASPSQASSAAEPLASTRAASPPGRNATLPEPARVPPGADTSRLSSDRRGACQVNCPASLSTTIGAAPGRSNRAGPAAREPREPPRIGLPSRPMPSTSRAKRASFPRKRNVPSETRTRRSRERSDRSSGASGTASGGVSASVIESPSAWMRTGRTSPARRARRERRTVPSRSASSPTRPAPPRSASPLTWASARTSRSDSSATSTSPPSSSRSWSTSSRRTRFSVHDDDTITHTTPNSAARPARTIASACGIRRTGSQSASRCSRRPFR